MFDKSIINISLSPFVKGVRRHIRTPALIVITIACFMFAGALNLHGEPQPAFQEYQVKAAFLYNFARFVEWPEEVFENPNAPITIGVLGEDPFGTYLDETIKNKTIKGRSLLVKRFKKLDDLEVCHILFISESEKKRLPKILSKLKNWHVLTVSDVQGFPKVGGIINLVTEENRIRFEINADAAKRADLQLSSHLLKLGKIVREDIQGENT